MNIREVRTATKIADFVLKQNHRNKITIKYFEGVSGNILNDDLPRIYLIVQDGVIKKIGGSDSAGGIKATMSFYVTAMTGSPGTSRFVLHLLIERALKNGSKVELYMITSPKVTANVNGLFSHKRMKISSFKEMENFCKSDYFSREGRYPDWNFQENNVDYPADLAMKHVLYHQERLNKKK